MTTCEAAQLVLQAGAMARGGEVFVLDMGEPVKILELAKNMIQLHGLVPYLEKDKNAKEGDICIKFSGLRPGEKLYEELLISDDAKETDHPRIKRALENKIDLLEITVILDNLQSACIKMDIEEIQHQLILAPADYSPAITA